MNNEVLIGGIEKRDILIEEYDPGWPGIFREHEKIIEEALDGRALLVEHVGSTSVPGLAAKSIIDIIVAVEDSGDEASYLPMLEEAGYILRVREPEWNEHRMLRTPELDVHVHIFSINSPEIERQLVFRNRLRANEKDRHLYETTKRKLAIQDWEDMNAYAREKSDVVERIIALAVMEKKANE